MIIGIKSQRMQLRFYNILQDFVPWLNVLERVVAIA